MNEKQYLVLIGDIVKSREIKNREKLQTIFQEYLNLDKINEKVNTHMALTETIDLNKNVVSRFTVTIGDEFQGVLKSATNLFKFVLNFEDSIKNEINENVKFRYGIGIGAITTKINEENAIGMDGPAFYNARESLNIAKNANHKYSFKSDSNRDTVINNMLYWLNDKMKSWSIQKQRILNYYRNQFTQKLISEAMQISQPAISKSINSSNADLIIQTEDLVENEINNILKINK